MLIVNDFESIFKACKELCEDKEGTFKVSVNRADKTFQPNSVETAMLLGGRILEVYGENLSVSVSNPSFTVFVDIREDGKTFVYTDVIKAMSGMPVGSSGKG